MKEARQLRRPYYLRRFRSQTSLISNTAIINMVATKMGAANIANIVSIFAVPRADNARERAERGFVPGPFKIQNRPVPDRCKGTEREYLSNARGHPKPRPPPTNIRAKQRAPDRTITIPVDKDLFRPFRHVFNSLMLGIFYTYSRIAPESPPRRCRTSCGVCPRFIFSQVLGIAWWAHQGSNLGPAD